MAKREIYEDVFLPPGTNKKPDKKVEEAPKAAPKEAPKAAPIKPPDPIPAPIIEEPERVDYSGEIDRQNRSFIERLRDGDINVIMLREIYASTSHKERTEKEDREREYLAEMGYDYDEIFDDTEEKRLLREYGIYI